MCSITHNNNITDNSNILLGGRKFNNFDYSMINQNYSTLFLSKYVYTNNYNYTFFLLIIILYHILGGFERIIWSDLKFQQDANNQSYSPAFQGSINNIAIIANCLLLVYVVNPTKMWFNKY